MSIFDKIESTRIKSSDIVSEQLVFTNHLFIFQGVSEEAQFAHAYKLFANGNSVAVHRHRTGVPCVPMTTPNGSDGCVRVVDGGTDSTGESVGPTLVPVSETG